MKRSVLIFIIFVGTCQHCSAQVAKQYEVDGSIQKKLPTPPGDYSELDIHWLENGKEINAFLSGKKMPCYALYTVRNDTISIILMQVFTYAGVQINIYKDSVHVLHFISSKDNDLKEFKQNKEQASYQSSPNALPRSLKLILTKVPVAGDPIDGYIEFASEDFFQRADNGDIPRAYTIKGYFHAIKDQ